MQFPRWNPILIVGPPSGSPSDFHGIPHSSDAIANLALDQCADSIKG